MSRLIVWTEEQAQQNLYQRLKDSKEDRRWLENKWNDNERIIFNTSGETQATNVSLSIEDTYTGIAGVDQSDASVGINYAFNPDDIWLFNKGQATGHFNIDIVPIYKRPVTFEGHVFHPEEDSSIMLRSYNKAPIMNTSLQDKIRKQIGVGIDYILG